MSEQGSDLESKTSVLTLLRRDPFVLFMLISLTLLGGDEIAIHVGGITLRIVFPLLMISCCFLYMQQSKVITFDKKLAGLFFALATAGAISTFDSYDPTKSIAYTIWVLFDFFVVIGLCYNFGKIYSPTQVLSLWFLVFRIHAVLIFAQLAYGVATHHPARPSLWFYEPSYLAIFMSAYFGSALFMFLRQGRFYRLDFLLATGAMLTITSATGIFGVFFAIILNFLVAKQRIKLLAWSLVLITIFLGTLYLFFQKTVYYVLIVDFLLSGNTLHLILLRGGNRIIRMFIGWQAFLQHPWIGIGIGADSAYMQQNPFPEEILEYANKNSNLGVGQPFCNVFIEILGTTGILGFVPFIGILLYAVSMMVFKLKKREAPESIALFIAFFSVLLSLQLDGTVLRYYLWSPLGLALGIMAHRNTLAPLRTSLFNRQPRTALLSS